MEENKYVIVIHGGVGTLSKQQMTPQLDKKYRYQLLTALQIGQSVLKQKGYALDAVQAAVRALENCQLFNAGKGASFNAQGFNELDACIMDGKTKKAGSVASVTTIKNPISAARKIMQNTKHVLLSGKGAQNYATEQGLEIVDPSYFYTQFRHKLLLQTKQEQKNARKLNETQNSTTQIQVKPQVVNELINNKQHNETKYGTVGAVALDIYGNLASAVSTGGLTNKLHGRVGDSSIVGAGCYANNKTCAISCTGDGQYFMRGVFAYDISAQMQYSNASLQSATNKVIHQKMIQLGGQGGVIAIDKQGNIALPFNTEGMYRAYAKSTGQKQTGIFQQ